MACTRFKDENPQPAIRNLHRRESIGNFKPVRRRPNQPSRPCRRDLFLAFGERFGPCSTAGCVLRTASARIWRSSASDFAMLRADPTLAAERGQNPILACDFAYFDRRPRQATLIYWLFISSGSAQERPVESRIFRTFDHATASVSDRCC
jgi:hypothetical protein